MNLIHLSETASTNSYLARLARENAGLAGGTVVSADYQTAGRGQRNNSWESERGKNLLFSLLIVPRNIEAASQFSISEAVSVGICDFLNSLADGFCVKWPNDIYRRGKKIGGILIENVLEGTRIARSIAGAGININQRIFLSDAPNPASLFDALGRETELDAALESIVANIMAYADMAESDPARLHQNYLSLLWRRGEKAWYEDAGGRFEGVIEDVRPDGILLLGDGSGVLRRYAFKEVAFVL